jgi:putative NADPH-quinone reductase
MRFLVLFAHPDPQSFDAALHLRVLEVLRRKGHEIDDCDLYAEGFEPVLSLEERRKYNDDQAAHPEVQRHIERLRAARGLIIVTPTWMYGMPAILKGYFDRVWLPGVAFTMVDGKPRSSLHHIERFAAVVTYGAPRSINETLTGDPHRRALMRGVARLLSPRGKKLFLAQYAMDSIGEPERARFIALVERRIGQWN